MHEHLWNDLPFEERHRLMPYATECQIRHYKQMRQLAVRNHRRTLAEIDKWISNLESELPKSSVNSEGKSDG